MFHMYKGPGYVRDVFRTRNMRDLIGNAGIAHCRYPTRDRRSPISSRSRST
jgi:amidophosphoribosyltransferase